MTPTTVGDGPYKPAVYFMGDLYVRNLEFTRQSMAIRASQELVAYVSQTVRGAFRSNSYNKETREDVVAASRLAIEGLDRPPG